ncbi:SDR family oxidoreductase [Streptomyces mangrovi]|uniref:SDR family oxidoreductase n=1 Tax=Streptomyces mangrovi TaxID=1206892 RepID=A0ABV9J7Z2_9ACTN
MEKTRTSPGPTGPDELFSVAGKTVVVTGGATGIGRMIAEGFVTAGARVVLVSRRAEACTRAAAELRQLGHCEAVVGDLATAEGADRMTTGILAVAPAVDVLVNNAGATWVAPLESHPPEAFDEVWAVNVKGLFRLTVDLLPALRAAVAAGSGDPARVINIGSIDGGPVVSPVENYAYSASKAAVHQLTRHLARALAGEGVTVNAVAPGLFATAMTEPLLSDPAQRDRLMSAIPLGRIGRAEDMTGVALFLASRAGAYVTGTVIPVDGGESGCG